MTQYVEIDEARLTNAQLAAAERLARWYNRVGANYQLRVGDVVLRGAYVWCRHAPAPLHVSAVPSEWIDALPDDDQAAVRGARYLAARMARDGHVAGCLQDIGRAARNAACVQEQEARRTLDFFLDDRRVPEAVIRHFARCVADDVMGDDGTLTNEVAR